DCARASPVQSARARRARSRRLPDRLLRANCGANAVARYVDLVDDPNAKLVADRTIELTAFLGELLDAGQLRTDFQALPISVGHHVPCHLKALGRPIVTARLLSLIPQLQMHTIDVSCSGMAGTYGLKRRNYWTSLEAGRPMLEELKRPGVLFGAAEC